MTRRGTNRDTAARTLTTWSRETARHNHTPVYCLGINNNPPGPEYVLYSQREPLSSQQAIVILGEILHSLRDYESLRRK